MRNILRRRSFDIPSTNSFAEWLRPERPSSLDWIQTSPRDVIRARYFPNIILTTQEGRKVRLYDDLIKDKVMLIHFMQMCEDSGQRHLTDNLRKVQDLLRERMGQDIFIYSFILDAGDDTAPFLEKCAAMKGAGKGWPFLSGNPQDMEMLRNKLGFEQDRLGELRYGNEPRLLWGACSGTADAPLIVEALSWIQVPACTPCIPS